MFSFNYLHHMTRPTSPLRRRANKTKNTSSYMNYYTANYTRLKALCQDKTGSVSNTVVARFATYEWKLLSEAERKAYSMTDVCFFEGRPKPEPESAPEPAPESAPEPAPEPESAPEPTPEVKTKPESEAKSEVETKPEKTKSEPEPGTKPADAKTKPEPETKPEPQTQTKSKPKVETKNQPKLVPKTFKPASKPEYRKADPEVTFIPVGE
jgi:hypothetical protein